MSDERRDFPVRAGHGDTLVDATRKVRDTVLEIVVGNLHDIYPTNLSNPTDQGRVQQTKLTRVVLDDSDFRAFGKLASSIAETILVQGEQ